MEIIQKINSQITTYLESLIPLIPKIGMALILTFIFLIVFRYTRNKLISLARSKAQDPLLLQFLDSILKIINIILGILLFLYIIGLSGLAGSILGAASISAIVIGFAFKDIGENFIAGVIMAFSRPFNLGDTISSNGVEGKIQAMTLRHTHVKTFDGKDVYIPNGQILKNPLYNYTKDGYLRKNFTIGIDYTSDVEKARSIMLKILKNTPGVVTEGKEPRTHITDLTSSAIIIQAQYWINTFDDHFSAADIHTDVVRNSLEQLESGGIEIPADIVEVKNYKGNTFLNKA